MNRKVIFCLLSACLLLTSCGLRSGGDKLPLSIGSTGEILVVMHDHLWKGAAGDTVRSYFTEPVWGLPAPEPMFTLTHKNSLSRFMQKFRNILIVNIEPGLEGSNLRLRNDAFASNQVIFNLDAPSVDSIAANLSRNIDLISEYILSRGREALISDYLKIKANPVVDRVKEKFSVDIVIPRPFTLEVDRENFVWIVREQSERQWGILIWEEPYLCTSQLETDSLINSMNAVTRVNVPGSVEGSFMANEPLIPPAVKRFEKNGVYTVQMNGLWQMQNGYMGGPYVNHTIIDVERGRLVTGLGFVFYPNRDKLQMIRQLEAILFSMTPKTENVRMAAY